MEIMRYNFSISREVLLNPDSMGAYLLHSGKIALIALQPVLITLLIAALIGPHRTRWLAVRGGQPGTQVQPHEPGGGA
ncbi:MAG: hypothetical protein ACFWT3_20760 [Pseudomonas lundensis]